LNTCPFSMATLASRFLLSHCKRWPKFLGSHSMNRCWQSLTPSLPLLGVSRSFSANTLSKTKLDEAEALAAQALAGETVPPQPKPDPQDKRLAFTPKPFFPFWRGNLRKHFRNKRRKRLGKGMSGAGGITKKAFKGSSPHSRTWESGQAPLFLRVPKWPEAAARGRRKQLEPLNLSKLRYFIEKGRIDTRYPITQRHLNDSTCVNKVKMG